MLDPSKTTAAGPLPTAKLVVSAASVCEKQTPGANIAATNTSGTVNHALVARNLLFISVLPSVEANFAPWCAFRLRCDLHEGLSAFDHLWASWLCCHLGSVPCSAPSRESTPQSMAGWLVPDTLPTTVVLRFHNESCRCGLSDPYRGRLYCRRIRAYAGAY